MVLCTSMPLQGKKELLKAMTARWAAFSRSRSIRFASSSAPLLQSSAASAASTVGNETVSKFKYDAPWLLYSNSNQSSSSNSSSNNNYNVPTVGNFINGTFSLPQNLHEKSLLGDGSCIPIYDPSTNSLLSHVYESSADDDDDLSYAIQSAKEAYPGWSSTPVQQRQRLLMEFAHLLHQKHVREEIAYWITLEMGKTVADAMGDVWRGLEVVEASGRAGRDMLGDSLQNLASGLDTISYRVPLGVCAGIAPFNFPAMIPLWMFPLAIATGNTYVLKPTEKAPSAALLLAKHLHDLGLPNGVLNIVNGGKETVDGILTHPDVRAVSFVGSNKAGEYIHDVGSKNGKRVQANLGAKNHATVLMDDADRPSTVKAIAGAAFGAAGQRCMALSVVILVGSMEESRGWVDELVVEAKKLTVGNGFVEGVDVGPLISKDAKVRAEHIIQQSIEEGATCKLDGRGVVVPNFENGNFLGPTIMVLNDDNYISSMDPISNPAYTEEIFAPVLTVLTVPTLDDAIAFTNKNAYGNGCVIFTSSGGAARKYQYEIEAGQVGINVPIPVPLPFFSFTGNKGSIRGDVNFYGQSGVNFFTQLKTVTSNWQYTKGSDLGGVTMPVHGKK